MSGIRNIRDIAKNYKEAEIYFHIDTDGITSAISMKEYLKKYGIKTIGVHKIQYGEGEYSIPKPKNSKVLPVLVDFAHGKTFMKIHTDHHQNQIQYQGVSNQFRHSKSNAETISSIISNDIFNHNDIKIINMIDSALYKEENITQFDMLKTVFKYDKEIGQKNHIFLGMICNKLILTYKNKKNFLEELILKSNSSIISLYNNMIKIINRKIKNKTKGFISLKEIEENSISYYNSQSDKKIPKGNSYTIFKMTNGQSILIGNCIFQIGGGNMLSTGSFDRYTAFRLYPQAKYFVMLWDIMGLLQISKNPWYEENNINEISINEIILNDIVKNKYYNVLNKHNISLLTMKKIFEKNITKQNEKKSIGFNMMEMSKLFDKDFSNKTPKEFKKIKKYMNYKVTKYVDETYDIQDIFNTLNENQISFYDIVDKLSGGHKSIVNISGFNLLTEQKWVDYKLRKNINPFIKTKSKSKKTKKFVPIGTQILKHIAVDCVRTLNNKKYKTLF